MTYGPLPPEQTLRQASPSPVLTLSCPKCSGVHDGRGARKWFANLRMCRRCVAERDARRAGRVG